MGVGGLVELPVGQILRRGSVGPDGLNYGNHPEKGPFQISRRSRVLAVLGQFSPPKNVRYPSTPLLRGPCSRTPSTLRPSEALALSTEPDEVGFGSPIAQRVKINRADVQICEYERGTDEQAADGERTTGTADEGRGTALGFN